VSCGEYISRAQSRVGGGALRTQPPRTSTAPRAVGGHGFRPDEMGPWIQRGAKNELVTGRWSDSGGARRMAHRLGRGGNGARPGTCAVRHPRGDNNRHPRSHARPRTCVRRRTSLVRAKPSARTRSPTAGPTGHRHPREPAPVQDPELANPSASWGRNLCPPIGRRPIDHNLRRNQRSARDHLPAPCC
jgi:hypothetical protein